MRVLLTPIFGALFWGFVIYLWERAFPKRAARREAERLRRSIPPVGFWKRLYWYFFVRW